MIRNFRIALVSSGKLSGLLKEIMALSQLETEFSEFESIEGFLSSDNRDYNLLVLSLESPNSAREILSSLRFHEVPVVIVYSDDEISLSDYKDLIINGAYGLVPESNLKSIIQHIFRLQDKLSVENSQDGSVMDDLFHSVFDNSDSLISIINSDYKYESVNQSFRKFHNLKPEELKGSCPSELWGEDIFRKSIEGNIRKSLNGEVIRFKAFFEKEESAGKCYEVIYRPFKHRSHKENLTLVETRDITSEEEFRKEAREAQNRNFYYEKFLPLGLFECNKEGEIIRANETFFNLLDIGSEDREKVSLKDYCKNETRFINYLKDVHDGEATTFSQLQMTTYSGNLIFTRISSYCRKNKNGELVVNATLEDNTREVVLERRLNQTHKIETLGTLAGGIAHDFNTILTTIAGYAELAADEVESDSTVFDYMTKLMNSVARAEDIVNQMLTFSLQVDIEKVPVDVETIVSEVCDFMDSALPQNITLKRSFGNIDGLAHADPTHLFRVFLNFMTNSMQAIEDNNGLLEIAISEGLLHNSPAAAVTISDTGKGIDNAIIDRIFEPFFTSKPTGEGSGMGLAVAHGIISGLGGDISVDSTPGEGTSFTINIPVYDREYLKDSTVEEGVDKKTILYIDNNLHFSRTVSLALDRLGYEVRLVPGSQHLEKSLKDGAKADYLFLRCALDDNNKDQMLTKINDYLPDAKLILITKPGASAQQKILNLRRENITVLSEPVTLHDIASSLQTDN